jgi:hypothetical protein
MIAKLIHHQGTEDTKFSATSAAPVKSGSGFLTAKSAKQREGDEGGIRNPERETRNPELGFVGHETHERRKVPANGAKDRESDSPQRH